MRAFFVMMIVVSMSGCTAIETSSQLYQMCKYQDKCPIEVVGNWLSGGQIMNLLAFILLYKTVEAITTWDGMMCVSGCG